jgi:hypothetical protein
MVPTSQPTYPGQPTAEAFLFCSPPIQITSPISCTSAETFQGPEWPKKPSVPVSLGAAQQQGLSLTIGCKRKAGRETDLTPCSSLANLSGCQRDANRPITSPSDAASPHFRFDPGLTCELHPVLAVPGCLSICTIQAILGSQWRLRGCAGRELVDMSVILRVTTFGRI